MRGLASLIEMDALPAADQVEGLAAADDAGQLLLRRISSRQLTALLQD